VIRARIVLDERDTLRSFSASGHAERFSRGRDIVCAAFSVLARTAYKALGALPGIELRGEAEEPGALDFEVLSLASGAERAAGIADFLLTGLGDLAREYPDAVALTIERNLEE
jgi:uncharacterized protein YsxB (DUF464 family)